MANARQDLERQAAAIEALWRSAREVPCGAAAGPVLAEGRPGARLMLIGEAPGFQEVKQGRPFAGPAGRLLDRLLEATGLRRNDVWITNVVKCRPMTEVEGQVRNRPPTVGEQKQWKPLLFQEIETLRPDAIICLGAFAARAIFGSRFRLTQERGEWRDSEWGIPALATFHPAYALHLEGDASDRAVATMIADFNKVVARLEGKGGATAPPPRDYGDQGRLFE